VLHWLALGLRHGSFTLPTAANPNIETGGLCGESKLAILRQVQGEPADWLARSTGLTTHAWDVRQDMEAAEQAMATSGLTFPLVAKPDVGCNGSGVRLIEDPAALFRYLRELPRETDALLQE